MDEPNFLRLLVMGCSRSGTTLLQGLLASHPRVHTFPETGVFLKALGMRGKVLPWVRLGLTAGKERKALARLLPIQAGARGPLPDLPPRTLSLSRSMVSAVRFFDGLAAAHEKDVWVEKTPRHVLHASRISRLVPGVHCIHMLRRGTDVVASIVDRARKHPDRFPRQADPAYGIRQWNQSVQASHRALGEPGHALVVFESLVDDVACTVEALCDGLGLEYEDGMASPADRRRFTTPDEHWKEGADGPVRAPASKFDRLFDEPTRTRIRGGLEEGLYDDLAGRASGAPGGVLFSGS